MPGDSPNLAACGLWAAGRKVSCRGFPTDFPVVGSTARTDAVIDAPWLPYRFPCGRLGFRPVRLIIACRGFPTDFPVVGSTRRRTRPRRCRGFPTDFPVVGSRRANDAVADEPWLPYRFPCGRLYASSKMASIEPWLPYRFPCGRLRAPSPRIASGAVASLPISLW